MNTITTNQIPAEFEISGSMYVRHENGVIEQVNPGKFVYDTKYIEDRYETYRFARRHDTQGRWQECQHSYHGSHQKLSNLDSYIAYEFEF